MLDSNCPQYDIADRTQALRFATFLVQICTQWTTEFNEQELRAQEALSDWWRTDAPRWRWKMAHQEEEPVYKDAVRSLHDQADRAVKVCGEAKSKITEQISAYNETRGSKK